jgi:hypothetical protein
LDVSFQVSHSQNSDGVSENGGRGEEHNDGEDDGADRISLLELWKKILFVNL